MNIPWYSYNVSLLSTFVNNAVQASACVVEHISFYAVHSIAEQQRPLADLSPK